MKLIDFDALFDKKVALYMEQNKGKYSERQWEDVIAKLYAKFGDTYVAKIQCTPREYYAKMTEQELVETLKAHLEKDVPVPEFLCERMESVDCVTELIPLLFSEDESTVTYAVHLISADARAYDAYLAVLAENRSTEDARNEIICVLRYDADAVKERAYELYQQGKAQEEMLEILSKVKARDERIFEILLTEFEKYGEKMAMRASYLADYGDDRALPALLKKIEDRSLGFVDFQEIKYAVERLGGEYNEPRDFSADKDYIAVEDASKKEGFLS